MSFDNEQKAKVFKALCDAKRIAILKLLRSGEKCACKIAEELSMAQSALSYHMKILCESQLVNSWNVGKWTHYEISVQGRDLAIQLIHEITSPLPHAVPSAHIKAESCTQSSHCQST